MADNVERTPGVFTFVSGGPCLRQVAKKRVEGGRRASEKLYGVVQVVFHHAPQFLAGNFRESEYGRSYFKIRTGSSVGIGRAEF